MSKSVSATLNQKYVRLLEAQCETSGKSKAEVIRNIIERALAPIALPAAEAQGEISAPLAEVSHEVSSLPDDVEPEAQLGDLLELQDEYTKLSEDYAELHTRVADLMDPEYIQESHIDFLRSQTPESFVALAEELGFGHLFDHQILEDSIKDTADNVEPTQDTAVVPVAVPSVSASDVQVALVQETSNTVPPKKKVYLPQFDTYIEY